MQLQKDIEREVGLIEPTKERALRALRHARNDASRRRIADRLRDDHRERLDLINTLILKYNYIAPNGARRAFLTYPLKREMAELDAILAGAAPAAPRP
jgi:hypothetical protein